MGKWISKCDCKYAELGFHHPDCSSWEHPSEYPDVPTPNTIPEIQAAVSERVVVLNLELQQDETIERLCEMMALNIHLKEFLALAKKGKLPRIKDKRDA